jgi:hypothetical protein
VKLSAGLAKQDKTWGKGASEPYLTWLDRLKTPNNAEDIDELKSLYRKHRYGRDGRVDKAVVGQMMSIVKRLVGRAR